MNGIAGRPRVEFLLRMSLQTMAPLNCVAYVINAALVAMRFLYGSKIMASVSNIVDGFRLNYSEFDGKLENIHNVVAKVSEMEKLLVN